MEADEMRDPENTAAAGEEQMTGLAGKACVPCRGGIPPLTAGEIRPLHDQVPDWHVVDHHHLKREFRFADFKSALKFVDCVGAMAEEQGHHPDIHLAWGRVCVEVWTHKIDGLTESDFIFAAKTGEIWKRAEGKRG
jgi:4a-hydroxytetrahydrobiopterin dehydratase